jgi:hypothetical protein
MKLLSRAFVTAVAAGAAAALVSLTGTVGATAAGSGTAAAPALTRVADEAPGYAVEDFAYPDADRILAEQGIVLKRGDGHITLAACGSETGLLEVWARSKEKICFRISGNGGYLSLEIPSVYGVKGNTYATEVTMTVEDEEKSFDIAKNTWTPVGESADPNGRDHMLVEIRATR